MTVHQVGGALVACLIVIGIPGSDSVAPVAARVESVSAAAVAVAATAVQSTAAGPAFRGGVETVRLEVSVTRGGAPVKGLSAADFVVTDNGVRQDVETVSLELMPLSLQLLFDTSGSVRGEPLSDLAAAGTGVVSSLRDGDEVGLTTFSGLVRVQAPPTHEVAEVREALRHLRASGQTALRDAVQLALALPHDPATRPMMLLFTDGLDGVSWLTEEDAIESARLTGTVIHVVNVGDSPAPTRFLVRLAAVTGGRAWSAGSRRELTRLFTSVLDEMRNRYLVSFTPRGQAKPGWHDVKVSVRSGADVVARPGYLKP